MEAEFSRLERFAHFWVLVGRSFVRNRCPVRAAALSYTTLLALIPLLVVAISVTSSLLKSQGEEKIYEAIDKLVSNVMPPATTTLNTNGAASLNLSPDMSVTLSPTNSIALTNSISSAETDTRVDTAQKEAAQHIHEFIQNTRSGALGVIGMLLLVSVAIRMLASIESTFNDIWGVTRGRNWLWRIILYWTTITLGPLLIVGALGLAGGSQLQATKALVGKMPFVGELIFQFVPLVVLWLAFALIYLLVPNTKVRFGAAFIGGIVGGSLWHLNNVFGFLYVSRVVTNSKIYGGLGLVPVFMVGLYFSWVILLFGAQVAYAFQNRKFYLQEKLAENVNQRGREFIALRLMTLIGQRFQHGEPAGHAPANLRRARHSHQACATGFAAAARRAARHRNRRRRTGLPARAPARRHQRAPCFARHPRRGGTGYCHARRAGAGGSLGRIRQNRGSRTRRRVVGHAAGAGQPRAKTNRRRRSNQNDEARMTNG